MIDLVSLIRAFTKVVEVFVIECTNLAFIKIISVIVSKVAIRHGGPWCSLLIISPQHNNHSTAHWIFEMAYLKYFLYFYWKYVQQYIFAHNVRKNLRVDFHNYVIIYWIFFLFLKSFLKSQDILNMVVIAIAIDKHFTAVAICTSCLLFTIIETQRGAF